MRYVGLVFLGMVLWAGQASAERIATKEAVKILIDGRIMHQHLSGSSLTYRVIYRGTYYICYDGLPTEDAYVTCHSAK